MMTQNRLGVGKPAMRSIPCVGWTIAGAPTDVESEWDRIEVPDLFGDCDHLVALRVFGESMTGAHILPGDVVIVHRQADAEVGDLVIACTAEGWNLKRWEQRGAWVCLRAENHAEPDRWLLRDAVEVWGVVVGVLRKYR